MLKKKLPLSYEERHNGASAKAEASLVVFNQAIADLEDAAVEQREISDDTEAEITRLHERIAYLGFVQEQALIAEASTLAKADQIHALTGN